MSTTTTTTAPTSTASATAAPSCTSAVPDKHGHVPSDACNSLYQYDPQFAPTVVFTALFAILAAAHLGLAIHHKKSYCWVLIMGVVWETGGYVLGALGALNQQNSSYSTGNQLLLYLAPLWVNAFVYMTMGRMIHYFLPERRIWIFKGRLLGRTFVLADITCFVIQLIGVVLITGGSQNNNVNVEKNGLNIFKAGALVQQGFIGLFLVIAIAFHVRCVQLERRSGAALRPQGWLALSCVLYFVLAMITMRIVYMFFKLRTPNPETNPLPFHEEYDFGLDGVPVLLACLALAVIHPGRVLVGPDSEIPKGAAKKQLKRQEKEEKAQRKLAKKGITDHEMGYIGGSMNQIELGRYGASDEHLIGRT